jgi:hypothetical protein
MSERTVSKKSRRRRLYSRDLLIAANGGKMPKSRAELVRLLHAVHVFPEGPWPMAEDDIALVVALVFDPLAATSIMHDRVTRNGGRDGKA